MEISYGGIQETVSRHKLHEITARFGVMVVVFGLLYALSLLNAAIGNLPSVPV